MTSEIWNGLITTEPYYPTGYEWDQFAQEIIDEFQDPMWDFMPHLPADASTGEVDFYAGMLQRADTCWLSTIFPTYALSR